MKELLAIAFEVTLKPLCGEQLGKSIMRGAYLAGAPDYAAMSLDGDFAGVAVDSMFVGSIPVVVQWGGKGAPHLAHVAQALCSPRFQGPFISPGVDLRLVVRNTSVIKTRTFVVSFLFEPTEEGRLSAVRYVTVSKHCSPNAELEMPRPSPHSGEKAEFIGCQTTQLYDRRNENHPTICLTATWKLTRHF